MKNLPRNHISGQAPSGQALLIIVLTLAVAVTVGLAVISRSITSIKISSEQEESARVFSVAEAGIEESLKAGAARNVTLEGIEAQVTETTQGGGTEYIFPKEIDAGDIQTIWLIGHTDEGVLDPDDVGQRFSGSEIGVYWGNQGTASDDNNTPALEATLFYREGTEFKTKRFAVDPNSGRRSVSNFDSVNIIGCNLGDEMLAFCQNFDLQVPGAVRYALRLKLLYNDIPHLLGVEGIGGVVIPRQGKCYISCAVLPESEITPELGITRCVQHCQPYKAPPGIFDYALYNTGDLAK